MSKKPGRNRSLIACLDSCARSWRFQIQRQRPEGREGRRCGGRGTDCGDSAEELADKERRSLDIFGEESGKAVTAASEMAEVQEGIGVSRMTCDIVGC